MPKTKEKIVILIRIPNQWQKFDVANSLEEAEQIWQSRISKKGITAWTEFATEKEAEKMLKDASYSNQSNFN